MDSQRLLDLVNNLEGLEQEAIPLLQDELENRSYEDAVLKITEYLAKSPQEVVDEPQEDTSSQYDSGQPIERIKQDLENQGFDAFDLLNEEQKIKSSMEQSMRIMKQKGLSEDEIKEQLKKDFGVDDHNITEMKSEARRSGKWQKILGILMVLASVFALLVMVDGGTFYATPFLLLVLGIALIIYGSKRMRSNR